PFTFFGDPVPIYTGVLETRIENGIAVLCGAGVGGGSLVYNCYTYQPPRELFHRVFPPELDYDQMDQVYYPRVRSILKPALIPQDILSTSYYLSTRVFLQEGA
ncbi:MAG: GMC oxidoreductase, partial [Nostoc sp.]